MNRILRRGISAMLAIFVLVQNLPAALAVWEENSQDTIEITEAFFPDAAFRSWLKNPSNINGYGADGLLTAQERADITSIDVSNQRLTSLQGIAYFPALEQLDCKNNSLQSLDVSGNMNLKHLHCAFNRIRSLDVSGLHDLISLNCESNGMTALNLNGCTALETIYCRNNNLPSVDFSTNIHLKFIETFDNQLTSVDLSKLTALEFVHLDHNRLTHLDLSHNTNLNPIGSGFVARNNHLETLTLPVSDKLVVESSVYDEQDPRTGFERTEWYLDKDFTQPVPDELQANGQTLYVKWLPNDYTVSYAANGGSGSTPAQSAVWDTLFSLQKNGFSRRGYLFSGWENTFGDGTVYSEQQQVKNIGGDIQGDNVTLYAQWQPIQYHIAFDANTGSGQMDAVDATYDQSKQLPACTLTAPSDDKEFAGWSLQAGDTVKYLDQAYVNNLTAEADETVTLYAVWREKRINLLLKDLDKAFAAYTPADYTTQDWNGLIAIYTQAQQDMVAAQQEQLDAILAQAKTDMEQILTLTQRASQAVTLWKNAYADTLRQINGRALDEVNAAGTVRAAGQAAESLNAAFVKDNTDLQDTADQQLVAMQAMQQVASTMQGLRDLEAAARWVTTLNGLSLRAMHEVIAASLPDYETAIQESQTYSAFLKTDLVNALQQRAELARSKQQAMTQLHMEHSSYDLSKYSEDGIQQLNDILHTAIDAIETADSVSTVSALLTQAQQDMQAVPDSSGQAPPDESGDPDDGNHGDDEESGGAAGGGGALGGGGGAMPAPEQPTNSAVTLPASGSADASGKVYIAQVTADVMQQSVQGALQAAQTSGTAPSVRIKVTSAANTEQVRLNLSASAAAPLGANAQSTLTMDTTIGSITLDAAAIAAATAQANDRTLTIVLSAAAKTRGTDSAQQWKWQLLCAGKEITDLRGGHAIVGVPYMLESQQNTACVTVAAFDAAGEQQYMQPSYDAQRKLVCFVAAQPCTFVVAYDETQIWQNGFADVNEQAWYFPAVRYVCYHDMMNGNAASSFAPDKQLSRAQLAQILYNMEDRPQVKPMEFSDVPQSAWYASAVSWAAQAGILTGYGKDRMGPNDPVTREQLAAMLFRYAEKKGCDMSAQADLSGFADAASISAYARQPLAWAHALGIVNGTGTDTLSPVGTATRAQAAAMLMRLCENTQN